MSALAEYQGIPIPADEIRAALASVAIPGYTGTLYVEIGLRPEAAACVAIAVIRRQSKKVDDTTAAIRQELPDLMRKKPVDKVIDDLKSQLFIRTVLTAVEAHYRDGVVMNFTVVG